jgi:hypothetical protein
MYIPEKEKFVIYQTKQQGTQMNEKGTDFRNNSEPAN